MVPVFGGVRREIYVKPIFFDRNTAYSSDSQARRKCDEKVYGGHTGGTCPVKKIPA